MALPRLWQLSLPAALCKILADDPAAMTDNRLYFIFIVLPACFYIGGVAMSLRAARSQPQFLDNFEGSILGCINENNFRTSLILTV